MSSFKRIVINDYGGHHFPSALARALAERGFEVLHLYFTQCMNPAGVEGKPALLGYTLKGLSIAGEFKKFDFVKRRQQEIEYGHIAAREIEAFKPDLVISSTTPIDAQAVIQRHCRKLKIPFVFWLQDIVSIAMSQILPRKLPVIGHLIGAFYRWSEARMLRRSEAVIAISDHFLPICEQMGADLRRCHVIENWAPLDEITPQARPTAWAKEQGLDDKRVILYSGTLGFKHNPEIFEKLASHFASQPDIRVVVITEGIGATFLQERKKAANLDNLVLLPYQPYGRLSEVLSTGDIVMAVLEKDAGVFSVPSKVLSYLCAGRPILLSVPLVNLSAETVLRAKAGRAVAPEETDQLIQAAEEMLASQEMRDDYSKNARAYALETFDITAICARFEAIFEQVTSATHSSGVASREALTSPEPTR